MSDSSSFGVEASDYRTLLTEQVAEYRLILNQTERILRIILASIALVGSFVSAKYLLAVKFPTVEVPVPVEVMNKCFLPMGGVYTTEPASLGDFGAINYFIVLAIAGLILVLILEMALAALSILRMDRLHPFEGINSLTTENVVDADYSEWVHTNQTQIREASEKLRTIYTKSRHVIVLLALGTLITVGVILKDARILIVIDALLVVLSPVAILLSLRSSWTTYVGPDGLRLEFDEILSKVYTLDEGPLFQIGLAWSTLYLIDNVLGFVKAYLLVSICG